MTLQGLPIRADDLRLIAILEDGSPAFCPAELSPDAREVLAGTVQLYGVGGFAPPWIGYLAFAVGEIVGSCAFKSPPQDDRVEIACYTFDDYRRRGIGTAMAQKLIELAQRSDPSLIVSAQTPSNDNPAARILRRLGFRLRDSLHHPQDGIVWYWEREAACA
ncbi:MAG TPA: GNAT family N-acetyltransferase [Solimonas sp.]|nr:GNAT family N-acetyltransferase [Solimonas sp.]